MFYWAANARGAAEDLVQSQHDAQLGYVFAATRAQEPRTIHYLVVPPSMVDQMVEEGILSLSDSGRITANFQVAIMVHSGKKGWERDHWDKLLFRVDL